MAIVTLTLPNSSYAGGVQFAGWEFDPGSYPSLGSALSADGSELFLESIELFFVVNFVRIYLTSDQTEPGDAAGDEFSDLMKASGTIRCVASDGQEVTITGIGDPTEPYAYSPTNGAAVQAFAGHVHNDLTDRTLVLTFNDGAAPAPLTLADFDDTGLGVEAAALSIASAPGTSGNNFYVDSSRGGSDSPIEGELGVGPGETVISRMRRASAANLTLNDNDLPVALGFDTFFGTGGAGEDLSLYLQTTSDGLVSFTVASAFLNAGGNWLNVTLPAAARTLLDNLATGDRFIFALARPQNIAPSFADDTGDPQTWPLNQPITPVTVPEATGVPTPTYAVFGALPAGISFDTSTRVISGTPTAVGSGTITIRAINTVDRADWTVTYTVTAGDVAPSFADDTGDPQSWVEGQEITAVKVPIASGTPTPTYAVVGTLPLDLAFDTTTLLLSGTPRTAGSGTITVRAMNPEGTDDWTVSFTTTAMPPPDVAPSFVDNTGAPQTWTQNQAITPVTVPAADGSPAPTYAVVGTLPAGLAFDSSTRILTGAPTAVGSGTITIRASNSEGNADWTVAYATAGSGTPSVRLANYRLEVDWEGDGLFAHADVDVYPDTRSDIKARRGRNFSTELYGRVTAGSLRTTLNNSDRKYDRFNPSSDLFGLVVPGRRVRLRMDAGDGVFETIWGGRLDLPKDKPRRGGSDMLEFKALGVFSRLTQEYIQTPMLTSVTTGEAVEADLDEAGIPASERGVIEVGGQTLPRYWGEGYAMASLEALEETEGGLLYEDRQGYPAFQTRTHRIAIARNAVFVLTSLRATAGQIGAMTLPGDDPLEELVNEMRVSYRSGYSVGSSAILWELGDTPRLGPGDDLVFEADYPGQTAAEDHLAVDSWDPPQASDYQANEFANGSGTDRSSSLQVTTVDKATTRVLTVENTHASPIYITRLRVRGVPLIGGEIRRVIRRDETSITRYERKSYPLDATFLASAEAARDYGDWILLLRADPQRKSFATVNMNDNLAIARDLELSQLVQLIRRDDSSNVFIESVEHTITKGGRHDVKMTLTPAEVFGNVMILGIGALDVNILG